MEVLPEGVSAPLKKGPGLYEFLVEAQLQHYFNSFKNNLKVTHPSQLKFTTEGDLSELGMSKPEMRRLRKYYEKHFPNNYLSKFKKLLSVRKQESIGTDPVSLNNDNAPVGRATRVPSKHIIPAANITVNKELGMGEFGVVQQGVWCNEGERIQVAIKCLARERMQTNTIEFLKEAAIMHSIDHHHIVRFFGVVLDTGSLMLVTELAPLRSLLECLKEPSLRTSFPVLTLCDFAVQICDGMQYLESKRLIHRDLAARNILVFSKNKVKISDFGLSRALGQGKDYYKTNFNVNLKLPIAWCAPECISYLRFTTATDVWAFGVTLWEMFSYGFQPWAALTGQQILESIDEPNFQRLEQPDCCPQDHYALMLDCWRHEASSRPRFIDISTRLIDCRPEQVQTKVGGSGDGPHLLHYRIGDVITVLDKVSYRPYWKGVASSGKAGLFDPINVVAYLGSDLPSSNFLRTDATRTSARRKLRSEMISAPQGDFKHTGHVGLDGAYFGDISFLGGAKVDYGGIPTQVVAPYRPHEDLEIAPLLEGDRILPPPAPAPDHEYHEISDDENNHSPSLDLGPSLMAEMQMVFKTLGQPLQPPPSPADHETTNKTNEMRERNKPRKQVVNVKPISAQDQKTLDTAIALANEITTRSMSAPAPTTPSSPTKRKFSFRFPSVTDHHHEKIVERRNFSEEAQSTPDLQSKVTEQAQLAYESLVEKPEPGLPQFPGLNPLRLLRSGQLPTMKPRSRTSTLPNTHYKDRTNNNHDLEGQKRSALEISALKVVESIKPEVTSPPVEHFERVVDENPIPLPPRDRNKPLLTSKPRHTRKHPLIIPPLSLQGTLNKFSTGSPPVAQHPESFTVGESFIGVSETHVEPVYSNHTRDFDTESIHFEQQIESELAALDDIAVADLDCVDAIGDSVSAMNNGSSKLQSHHVSCEELLEFADTKPSSRARGFDSDEVRIMSKVLGSDIDTEQCIQSLEFTNWNVLNAIKLYKLQKIVIGAQLNVCNDALEVASWDVSKAAQWLLNQDSEVQV
ncbi:PREDICTED: tyrosine-protein kinase PR2 isoform X2 [Nicrophorus vespilloides]|uniref:non-specific protein-tyrosine kinase n=1 Tax=Nicrophorus vespilloides TaxID=110193 RepID=A0ABM1MDP4_NICVS|nr:PREDICTED: tyrosine-protein kinase PR2 isoform X2 [Nicrophorus vespilloides]